MARTLAWLGLALALAAGAAVRWTRLADVEDLRPRPDALEYEEGARNLASGEGYCLVLDGGRYPPRYPPGFSALIVPAVWLGGGRFGVGVWSVLATALVGIAATWWLGRLAGGPASAAAAALLLALAPLHARWSRAVMADVPSATATTLLALAAVRCAVGEARPRAWFALGAASALSALVRFTGGLVAVPIAVVAVALRGTVAERLRRGAAVGGGVVCGAVPGAMYAFVRFGSPLATGYGYWIRVPAFGWRYATTAPIANGREGNLVFYLRELVGGGALYGWPIAVAVACGLALAARGTRAPRVLAGLAVGSTLLLLGTYVPYWWQWDRFLLPLLPLLLVVAAVPVGASAPVWLRVGGAALLAAGLAGAFRPRAFDPPNKPSGEVAALRSIAARIERNAVLIARSDVLLVSRLVRPGTDRLWLPIDRCEHRELVRALHVAPYAPASDAQDWVRDVIANPFDPATTERALRELVAAGRPVYFTPMQLRSEPLVRQLLALLNERFVLRPVPSERNIGLVQVLTRDAT